MAGLGPEERRRANRFVFPHHRSAYIQAHLFLRDVLASYLGRPAAELEFSPGEHGKPFLPRSPLRFNLSHSGDRVLLGVALHREIGVDIEERRPGIEVLDIARHYFSSGERAFVERSRPREEDAFFRIWACKEAYMKAKGMGFSLPPNSFDVCGSGGPGTLSAADADRWVLKELDAGAGFAAAVVAGGPDWMLREFDYGHPAAGL